MPSFYLITWNPRRSSEYHLIETIAKLAAGKRQTDQWSCGNNKHIKRGDRVFLLRQGNDNPGIVASARVTKGWFPDKHWDAKKRARGVKANAIRIDWDYMVAPADALPREQLLAAKLLPRKLVNIASGGVTIPGEYLSRLEKAWSKHRLKASSISTDHSLASKNHLGHRSTSKAARLNELLKRGATMSELRAVRGAVYEHLKHLRDKFGIQYVREGNIYRLVETSDSALDDLPTAPPAGNATPTRSSRMTVQFSRNSQVRAFVLKRAKGCCEYCGKRGFPIGAGKYYVETHHILALSKQGPDTPQNVIALCANHHRETHFGKNASTLEAKMQKIVTTKQH